jgi:hypothetical protein
MLQLPGSGVRRLGIAALLAGASCSAPDSSGLFGPAPSPPITSEAPASETPAAAAPGDDEDDDGVDPSMVTTEPAAQPPGVSNEEGPPVSGGVTPPESTSSGEGSGSPVALPADAGVPLGGPAPDAGAPPSEPVEPPESPEPPDSQPPEPQPEPNEPEPEANECDGAFAAGSCWYLGARAQACDDVCATRGGFDPSSVGVVGTPDQGGSIEGCDTVIQALGGPAGVVNEGFREDGLGFGCHVFIDAEGAASAWWLTSPELSPSVADPNVQPLCGCAR